MRIPLIQSGKQFVYDKSAYYRDCKECNGFNHDHAGIGIRILETDHESQYDDTDHVVNDRGADNGGSYFSLDLAQLLKCGDGYTDTGGCHDRTDENGLVEIVTAPGRYAVEAHIQQSAQDKGNKDARTCDHKRNRSCLDQFFQV